MLATTGLCTYYASSQVLFDVAFRAPARGAVAILGRNGAGKTTLLKTIVGELRPKRGQVRIADAEVTAWTTEARVRHGLAYVPQEQAVFGGLSVRENLEVGALVKHNRDAIDRVLAIFPKLGQRLNQRAGTLSGGERKMLAIGRALLSEPRLLLLDEPTEGVWIGVIEEIAERLAEMAKSMAVVIVEQHIELALRIADYAYVMDRGHIAMHGAAAEVKGDPRLLRYLAP
ncbi:MAG: ABC transporter ATP-binding protein [Gammaproteobacteria bacterium]